MKKQLVVLMVLGFTMFASAQQIRFACIGNSITSGGTNDPQTDPSTYASQLAMLLGDAYDIQNFAVSGRTLLKNGDYPLWNEEEFPEALAFNPNMVTIMLGTNDSKPQNWVYKDEFVRDYTAMIDTFRVLEANPEVYLCLPPKAFSVQWGITDSIITTDIIPMIKQIGQDKNAPIIDFYTPFQDMNYLFTDDIHPSAEGSWEFAKLFYTYFTGDTVQVIHDVNLALNQTVETPMSVMPPGYLTDGDMNTVWVAGDGVPVVIDLGAEQSMDMFQIFFQNESVYHYLIETSSDNTSWNVAVDQTANAEKSKFGIDKVDTLNARYVRLTVNQTDNAGETIPIIEFKVLETAPLHAPVLTFEIDRISTKYVRFKGLAQKVDPDAYMKYLYSPDLASPLTSGVSYREDAELSFSTSVMMDIPKAFIAKSYKDGYEAVTDTAFLDYSLSGVEKQAVAVPVEFGLRPNYPNPFNAETVIPFHVAQKTHVTLNVLDVRGRFVRNLAKGEFAEGDYQISLNASDLSSGIYFLQMRAGKAVDTRKISLVK